MRHNTSLYNDNEAFRLQTPAAWAGWAGDPTTQTFSFLNTLSLMEHRYTTRTYICNPNKNALSTKLVHTDE